MSDNQQPLIPTITITPPKPEEMTFIQGFDPSEVNDPLLYSPESSSLLVIDYYQGHNGIFSLLKQRIRLKARQNRLRWGYLCIWCDREE
jgi:hypothetical protein